MQIILSKPLAQEEADAMPIEWENLPSEIQELRNKPVREGACSSEQPVCNPDERVTAQLTDDPPPDDIVKP